MSDRELLELAAKAVGLAVREPFRYGEFRVSGEDWISYPWNPRDDDGDAFRLETELSFTAVECADGIEVGEFEIASRTLRPVPGRTAYVKFDDHAGDKCAARRLAALRAAAEIGRAM